jgi:hypothetical protein
MATRIRGNKAMNCASRPSIRCDGGVEAFAHIGAFDHFVFDGHHAFDPGDKIIERGDLGGIEDGAASVTIPSATMTDTLLRSRRAGR